MNRHVKISSYLVLFALLGLVVFVPLVAYLVFNDLPSLEKLQNYEPPQSTQVFDRNNNLVGRFFDEKRTVIEVNKLPKHVYLAFIAAEDAEFYHHKGIDLIGLSRAILLEIKYRLFGGRRVGGSTITQQTAKIMLLSSSKTYLRKLKEMVLAKRIEEKLTKDQILNLYLNQIYFGNGAYGIEEASKTYFHKSANKLEIFEAAALASVPKSPTKINPFNDINALKDRQKYVLEQMLKHDFINNLQFNEALESPLFSATNSFVPDEDVAPYFLRAIKTELLSSLDDEYIRRGGLKVNSTLDISMQKLANNSLKKGLEAIDKKEGYRGPIFRPELKQKEELFSKLNAFRAKAFIKNNKDKIWDLCSLTKLDAIENSRLVTLENKALVCVLVKDVNQQGALLDLGTKTIRMDAASMSWALVSKKKKITDLISVGDIILVNLTKVKSEIKASLEQIPLINGAIIALDVKTGGVLAMTGGYDFKLSPFNRAVQAKRQIGSTIKPFIYSLAMDMDLVTPASIITDAPKAFLDTETNEFWRPRNHTNKFLGDITLRHCLVSSINICTISLLEKIGISKFLQQTKDVGLFTQKTPFPRNLTIALGSAENYPIQIANALRVFPNKGKFSDYHMIDKLNFVEGKTKSHIASTETKVLGEESAYMTTWLLKSVISSHMHRLSNVKAELAGKTGTTNKARTTWFYGFSPEILALVYIGYDDNRSIGTHAWGINTAFPIWADFMNGISKHQEEIKFEVPTNIEWRYIDQKNGKAVAKPEIITSEPSNSVPVENIDGEIIEPQKSYIVFEPFKIGTAPKIEEQEDKIYNVPMDRSDNSVFAP